MLLRPPHLVERVGRQAFDVEPVEDHPRVRHPRPQRLLPARRQVRRHQLDPFTAGRPQQVEERLQRLGTAPLAGPHHPPTVMIDDHCQVVVPFAVAELIDADSLQPVKARRVQLPRHHPLDDAADRLPRDGHQTTDRRAVHRLRQIRHQLLARRRESAAARRPRHLFDPHPAVTARHPPRRIPQPHRRRSPRHMPPQPLRSPVVARRAAAARPAAGPAPRRAYRHAQPTRPPQLHLFDVQLRETQQLP